MARFLITLLGSSKQNCDLRIFTVSILFVRKSFIKMKCCRWCIFAVLLTSRRIISYNKLLF